MEFPFDSVRLIVDYLRGNGSADRWDMVKAVLSFLNYIADKLSQAAPHAVAQESPAHLKADEASALMTTASPTALLSNDQLASLVPLLGKILIRLILGSALTG